LSEPKPRGKRKSTAKGDNPKLARRLPPEKGALIAPLGDGLTVLERAILALDGRVVETRLGFRLDGKPCNTRDILNAAGMKFADE
jgi:hypothetical protein